MAVITGLGALLGVAASLRSYFSGPKPVFENTEIVLDTSEAMSQDFEGATKLQAALDATRVLLTTVSDKDNLALREFGGPCAGDNTQLSVKLGTGNAKRVQKALQTLRPGGQTTLTHAVIEAIGDFNDPERFKGVSKRILVITGSDESCFKAAGGADSMEAATAAIKDRVERAKRAGSDIQVDFHFVGIGLTPEQQKNVRAVARAMDGKVKFVRHRADLQKVLSQELQATPGETASVLNDGTALVRALNASANRLKDVLLAIQKRDYAAADAALQQARNEWTRSEQPFVELGKRQSVEQFHRLYSLAAENRQIEDQLMILMKTMLAQARSNDHTGYNASKSSFDKLSSDYERKGEAIDQLLKELE